MENTNEDKELLLNQWQTCVDMANSVSQRRDNMNNIFITLNLAIMTAVSITWDIKSLFILIAGITICILWMLNIRNYKLLNTAKFNVINSSISNPLSFSIEICSSIVLNGFTAYAIKILHKKQKAHLVTHVAKLPRLGGIDYL